MWCKFSKEICTSTYIVMHYWQTTSTEGELSLMHDSLGGALGSKHSWADWAACRKEKVFYKTLKTKYIPASRTWSSFGDFLVAKLRAPRMTSTPTA